MALWGPFNDTFPFTVSHPLSHPSPLPVLSCLCFPLPIHGSLPFPSPFRPALRVLLTVAIVFVIAIDRTAPFTARRYRIHPVLLVILLINFLVPFQWSNCQEVAWLVLLAVWWHNLCPEIIATIPREMLHGVCNFSQAAVLRNGVVELIPVGPGVVPPLIVQLVAGIVHYLRHI